MQRRSQTSPLAFALLAALLFATALPLPAAAESSPSAQPWLDKLMALYDRGPFTFDLVADIDLGQMGQAIRGTLEGHVTYGDRQHLRQEMKMTLTGLPGSDGQSSSTMEILSVSDDDLIWTEIGMPGGGPQVMKISRQDAAKMAASQMGALGNPSSMDPVAQLETMSRLMDFELLGVAEGKVSLRATASAESLAELGQLGALGVDSFLLVLEESTGYPVEIRAGGPPAGEPSAEDPPPVVHMRFEDVKLVDRGDLPAGVFEYTPPEGVAVTDLGAMVGVGNN